MKSEMSWLDSTILSILSKFSVRIFFVFVLLRLLGYVFLRVAYINKYLDDKTTNNINTVLNYIVTYKNVIITVLCIVLTLYIL